jgi:hypothetical protein
MIYKSPMSASGNVGISTVSPEEAQAQCAEMDRLGCIYCSGCINCSDCIYCSDCINCAHCSSCAGCADVYNKYNVVNSR